MPAIDFRPVMFVLGIVSVTLAPLLIVCALVDVAYGNADWTVFVVSAVLICSVGLLLAVANWGGPIRFNVRQGFLVTVSVWCLTALWGAMPLYFSSLPISFTDSVFESVSGLTTTGSTVIVGLDDLPPGLLLWRSMLQWVGGVGVIAMSILLLPFLRVSGMQLFRLESSDVSDKAAARLSAVIAQVLALYFGATALCMLFLMLGGVTALDAVNHAFAAISTGGFGTHDASIGYFDSRYVEAVLLVTMIAGSLTFPLMVRLARGSPGPLLKDPQTHFYLKTLALAVALMSLWRMANGQGTDIGIVWSTAFNVVSIVTTTGFVSEDYGLWGAFPVALFLVLTLFGGCTGSTSGGIKAFRIQLLLKVARAQILTRLYPHRVVRITFGERPVEDEVLRSVSSFVWLTFVSLALGTLVLSATGLDLVTALSGAAQALANVGPGLGDEIGPAGNFAGLPTAAKWILSFLMILGRLEIITVLVVLSIAFWRH